MRKSLFFIAIAFLGNISGIKSQDMLSRQAPMDKQTSPTAAIQSDKKSVSYTEARTTATKKEPHLLFMGVPIDGSIEMFDQKISEKGFHKSSAGGYSGFFYGQFCVAHSEVNNNTGNVCEVLIRYNQLIAKYTENQLISLYNSIVRDLKKKYKTAKRSETSGSIVLSMPLGYIECKIYTTIFGKMGGGVNLTIRYVDKKNTPDYSVPTLKRYEDDL